MEIERVAIIGAGNIAAIHLRFLVGGYDLSKIAVCDLSEYQLTYFCQQHGIDNRYLSIDQLLSEFAPDVVHVCTAPSSHFQIAQRCLEFGAHVFVEKPFTTTYQEAAELCALAKKTKKCLIVGHMRLFSPLYENLKAMVRNRTYGELVSVVSTESYNFEQASEQGLPPWMSDLPGSIVYDLLPHPLSILIDLLPELSATAANVVDDMEANSQFSISFSGVKPSVRIEYFLDTDFVSNEVVFRFERALVRLDFASGSLTVKRWSRLPGVLGSISQSLSDAVRTVVQQSKNFFRFIAGRVDSYGSLGLLITKSHAHIQSDKPDEFMSLDDVCRVSRLQEELLGCHPRVQIAVPERPNLPVNVAVTGANGYVGSFLVDALLEAGYSVRVLVRCAERLSSEWREHPKLQLFEGDLSNPQVASEFCKSAEHIVHLAAASVGDVRVHIRSTVVGTANILEAVREAGCRKLIYVSSISVFDQSGYDRHAMINEEYSLEPKPERRGAYTYAKLTAEDLVRQAHLAYPELNVTVLRPGLVCGRGRELIGQFGFQMGSWLMIFGSPRRAIPLVHVDNVVNGILKSLNAGDDQTFNLVDASAPSLRQVIDSSAQRKLYRVVYLPRPVLLMLAIIADPLIRFWFKRDMNLTYRFQSSTNWTGFDTRKAERELGWVPAASFEDSPEESRG